jgi:predicted membrane protein
MAQHNAKKRILVGLLVMAVGALLLMRSFGVYEDFINEYIFRWEMILITIGVISILTHENAGPGSIMILVGGGLYARNYLNMPHNISFWQLFLAGIFILAGVFMIFKRKDLSHCEKKNGTTMSDNDSIDEVAVFGGGDKTIITNSFRGGKILAVFGGSNFNLTRAKLAPGKNYIDVLAVFGGLKLIVPEDWNIKISAISIFGGFSDKHRIQPPDASIEPESELIIKGFLIFGGGEIKSF